MDTLKFIFCVSLLLNTYAISSQTNPINQDLSDIQFATSLNKTIPEAEGSPYITENFSLVKLVGFDNKVYEGRFNAFNGDMEIKTEGKIIYLNPSNEISVLFTENNKLYKTYTYNDEDSHSKRGFLLVAKRLSKIELLKLEKIEFFEKKPARTSYDKESPAKFKRDADTYYLKTKGKVKKLPTRRKDFIETFPEYESELKKYIKNNKLNPKNESELVGIIEYLNSLMEKK